ncbi:MAG: DUF4406 domain-containing protein [Deltaproteobacteria bacterium]|nr:DUF4406 domain-containing protein [Deltaproteobacteria bacterium]
MKVYIAGKITGHPSYKEEFAAAEDKLTKEGFTVLNPAFLPEGFEQTEYHHINRAMIDVCDAVYFLPSWVDSKGAHMEMGYAIGTDKVIMHAKKTGF